MLFMANDTKIDKPNAQVKGKTASEIQKEEEIFQEAQDTDLSIAQRAVQNASDQHGSADSWKVATNLVKKFRPVSWFLWKIIRSVYGRINVTGKPDYIMFDACENLMRAAALDPILGRGQKNEDMSLKDAVHSIGEDVGAAICLIHGVCRRISQTLPERMWRPIIDDALFRAYIGYLVGAHNASFGFGRGMLAGFAGRCGLAVQIASGEVSQAKKALEGLAMGMEMARIGLNIYGSDPLQISAMTMIAAGCSSDSAVGISSYSYNADKVDISSSAFMWLAAFDIAEHLRMNNFQAIQKRYFEAFNMTNSDAQALKQQVLNLQGKGHGWSWIITTRMYEE